MMKKKQMSGLALAFCMAGPLSAQLYEWSNLPAGGGGYVTGIVVHPKEENLIYLRTDVGGIYRYEAPGNGHSDRPKWVQLMDWIPIEQKSLWSTDGIALNPQNPDELYVALGPGAGDGYINTDPYPQGVYKSVNRGRTWKQVLNKRYRGNQGNRSTGECIAVIPEGTGSIVLAGTRFDGLFRSENGGSTWKNVATVPTDASGVGIRSVAFDPSDPAKAYLTAYASGVYASSDRGVTFSLINGTAGINPRTVAVASDGTVWITSKKGVYKYRENALVRLTPDKNVSDYNSIAIDPSDPTHVIVTQQLSAYKTKIFRTTDAGTHWKNVMANKTFTNHVPWYKPEHVGAAVAGVAFNPFRAKELWFTDWYLPWKTDDVTASAVHFESVPWGVEELVIFDIAAPPTDAILYNACADNGGLRHESMTEYPEVRFGEQESTGIDFCEAAPASLIRVSSNGWGASGFRVSRSDNAGESWRTVYTPNVTGKVAYSAGNMKNYIFIPTGGNKTPLVTHDDGATWENAKGLPSHTYNKEFWNNYNRALISDRINGDKYYALISGRCYVSTDGGASFTAKASGLPTPSSGDSPGIYMVASPYREGEIWVSIGGKGLYYSRNSGESFSKIGEFTNAKTVAIGPPMRGVIPVIYTQAKQEALGWGLFASYDDGVNWTQINDDAHQLSNSPRQMAADRSYPGRLYIGSGGCGIYCGTCIDEYTQVVTPMITPAGGTVYSDTKITIKSLPEDAEIYYTLDGSEPTSASLRYTGPFAAGNATCIKAVAVKAGYDGSDVSEAVYINKGVSGIKSQAAASGIGVSYCRDSKSIRATGTENALSYTLRNIQGITLSQAPVCGRKVTIDTTRCSNQLLLLEFMMKDCSRCCFKIISL